VTNRHWSVSHGRDGFQIIIEEEPSWAPAYEWALEKFFIVTGHITCCKQPEWTWKVPLGKPRYHEDDPTWLQNSLGDVIWSFTQKLHNVPWKKTKRVTSIPIDKELGISLWPNPEEDAWLWDGSDLDDDSTE
jgi:hypothetical protein